MNENKDFAMDLITQNPNKSKEEKRELLKLFLERGDPNNGNSAATKKMRKIQNNPIKQTRYRVRDYQEEYPYRLMLWASKLGLEKDVEFFLSKGYSPFVKTRKKRNALFAAASNGHLNLVKLFLEKIEKPEDRAILLERSDDVYQNTPLHIAIKKGRIDVANYLVEAGAPLNIYNERGWLPHQMSRSTDKAMIELRKGIVQTLNEEEKTKLSLLGDFYKVKSRYQYCLIARKDADGSEEPNLVLEQLKKIQRDVIKEKKGQFHIAVIEGYENSNPRCKQKYLIFLIRIDDALMNSTAQALEIRVFNTKYRFLEKFDNNQKEEYEQFRAVTCQRMIHHILRSEFDVDLFLQEGLLLDAFPIHNFTERSQISSAWKQENKLKKIIKWNDLLPSNEARIEHLRPLTACTFYYGTAIGWYLTFLSSLTTDLLVPGLAFLPFAILNRLWYQNDNGPYIPYLGIIISVWATLWSEKWKRRQNEMRFLWDLTDFENAQTLRQKYGGEFKIDYFSKKIIKKDILSEGTRRIIVEIPLSLFGIGVIAGIFWGFIELEKWSAVNEDIGETADSIGSARTFVNYVASPIQGFCILIANGVYAFFARKAVDWENYRYESDRQNSYVFKSFVFQLVNSYITLFYYSFIDVNFDKVRTLLISFFVTKGLTQIGISILLPYVLYRVKGKRLAKKLQVALFEKKINIDYVEKSQQDPELEEISSDEENEKSPLENYKDIKNNQNNEDISGIIALSPKVLFKSSDSFNPEDNDDQGIELQDIKMHRRADSAISQHSNAAPLIKKKKTVRFSSRNVTMVKAEDTNKPLQGKEDGDVTPRGMKGQENDEDYLAEERINKGKKDFIMQIEYQRSVMAVKRELLEEYSYLAIMFGYITMFSPAFPWGPLILLVDMWALSTFTKRTYREESGSVGVWNRIFQIIAFVSIVVNGLFVMITTKTLKSTLGVPFGRGPNHGLYRDLIIVVVAEHIIMILKFLIEELIDDVPGWVQDATKERQYHQERAIQERTALGKKKSKEEMMLSEDMKFKKNMLKYLNNPAWLRKYLDIGTYAIQHTIEMCQCVAKALKIHTHEVNRKRDAKEFEAAWVADVQQYVERNTPYSSFESGAKLNMFRH